MIGLPADSLVGQAKIGSGGGVGGTWTPAEFMYMKIGLVGLSYCRYISSAKRSSVTAGTRDIPCSKFIGQNL